MTDNRKRLASVAVTLTLLALNLAAFNLLLAYWRAPRLDLTEDDRYSISPATERLLSALDEDVVIYGFFSSRTHPKLAPLVPQIVDMLDEYRALSRGRVQVEIVDPREDEQAEQEANDRYGVQSTPFRLASKYEAGIVNAYFAIVVKYADQYVRYGFEDLIEIEPLADDIEVRLRNLEYDLTRAIKKVVYGFRSSAELFERVEEPVRFTAVMSPDRLPELFEDVPAAVRTAAEELGERGRDKFVYEEIDPTADEQQQAIAVERFRVRPMALGLFGDEQFYLYGFLEVGGRLEQLALAGEEVSAATIREAVESSLRRLTPGFLKTVGLVTPQPAIPPEIMMQLQMQGRMPPQPPPEFEQIREFLGGDYEVRSVSLDAPGGVPAEIDTLVVLKPTDLDEGAVYNLDQYLMRGGRVIICSGSYQARFDESGLNVTPVSSGLDDWLAHVGVEIRDTLVLDERNQPLPIPEVRQTPIGAIRTWRLEPYPYLVEVRDEGLVDRQVTARLEALGIYWGSPLRIDPEKNEGREVIEILKSSARSWTSEDLTQVAFVGFEVPAEGTEPRLLAAALSGRFSSYFADKGPPVDEGADAEDDSGGPAVSEVPLEESPETRLAVIGNAAFVDDFVARALGTGESGFFAENLAFMQNLIDWMNLDSDLVGIRSRAAGVRRLADVDTRTEVTIELANYLIPLAVLLALGAWRLWRRRTTVPIVSRPAGGAAQATRRAEG